MFTPRSVELGAEHSGQVLSVAGVRDRAHVFLAGKLLGILYREGATSLALPSIAQGAEGGDLLV
jgi:hypothetical protein